MKIAIISDIHGNFTALESVLKDIEYQQIESVYCLGDIATLGPQPNEVIEIIRAKNITCITGNHEQALLDPKNLSKYDIAPPLYDTISWCRERLSRSELDFLKTFPAFVELDEFSLLLYHGSPQSSTDVLTADSEVQKLENIFSGFKSKILIGGHTHFQLMRKFGERSLLNAGSVGSPFKNRPLYGMEPQINPQAEYLVIDLQDSIFNVQFRQIKYDLARFEKSLREKDLPIAGWWITQLYKKQVN